MTKESDKQKAKAASKARGDAARAAGNTLPVAGTYPTKAAAIAASRARGNAVRATRPPVVSTTKKAATKKVAAAPAQRPNFTHLKETPAAAAAKKVATKKATAQPGPTQRASQATIRAAYESARRHGRSVPIAADYAPSTTKKAAASVAKAVAASTPTKKAAASPGKKALTAADRFMQAAANKIDAFKTTEADPLGWASIAKALGNAGDKDFRAYNTGSRATSEARKYVKAKQAKATKSGRGPR